MGSFGKNDLASTGGRTSDWRGVGFARAKTRRVARGVDRVVYKAPPFGKAMGTTDEAGGSSV
jgi:hypothetical protein